MRQRKEINGAPFYWHCVCDCGNEVDVTAAGLVHGNYHSCGCLQKKNRQEIMQRRHLVDGTCVEVLEKRKSRKDNMSGFRGVFQLKNCNRYRVEWIQGKALLCWSFWQLWRSGERLAAENLIHNGFIQKWKNGMRSGEGRSKVGEGASACVWCEERGWGDSGECVRYDCCAERGWHHKETLSRVMNTQRIRKRNHLWKRMCI